MQQIFLVMTDDVLKMARIWKCSGLYAKVQSHYANVIYVYMSVELNLLFTKGLAASQDLLVLTYVFP